MTENPSPPSETFAHNGTTVRVTMTDPAVGSPYEIHLRPIISVRPRKRVTKPTDGFAIYCPATFTVEGLPYAVEFTIGTPTNRVRDIVITSMRIDSIDGIDPRTIPSGRLLAAALKAASVTVMHYPANYDGPAYGIDNAGWLVKIPGMNVRTDNEPEPIPVRNGGDMPDDFTKAAAGVSEVSGDHRLREIARIVTDHEAEGLPYTSAIQMRFNIQSDRHVRRLVNEARAAGYLPPLHENDRRTRKDRK